MHCTGNLTVHCYGLVNSEIINREVINCPRGLEGRGRYYGEGHSLGGVRRFKKLTCHGRNFHKGETWTSKRKDRPASEAEKWRLTW